jgi:2-amino-4-hydroxy-6-hydroxymethyldihydropteridine diphosphokinase
MILVALGSNVSGPWGNPRNTVRRALRELDQGGLKLVKASRLLVTKPFGVTGQPDFINAVARIETKLKPEALLRHLHAIEASAGRLRAERWGPRTLDLDLLDYNGLRRRFPSGLVLPHPGIAERLFVLEPLAEIAPGWVHPVLRRKPASLILDLISN